jgi:hypothetical protein
MPIGSRFVVMGLGVIGGLFLAFRGGQYFDDEWCLLGASLLCARLILGGLSLGFFYWGLFL